MSNVFPIPLYITRLWASWNAHSIVAPRLIKFISSMYKSRECTESGILRRFSFRKQQQPFVAFRASSMPEPNSPNRTRNHVGRCARFSPISPTPTRTRAHSFINPQHNKVFFIQVYTVDSEWWRFVCSSRKDIERHVSWWCLSLSPPTSDVCNYDDDSSSSSSESARSLPWVQETLPRMIRWHGTCHRPLCESFRAFQAKTNVVWLKYVYVAG